MPEAHFEVEIKSRTHLVAIDSEIADKLGAMARARHTSSERLVNSWLREKLEERADGG